MHLDSGAKMKKFSKLIRIVAILGVFAVLAGVALVYSQYTRNGDESPSRISIQRAEAKPVANADYNLSSIVVMTRVISYIKNYYYDPGRIDPENMFRSALNEVARSVPSVMVDYNEQTKQVLVKVDTEQQSFPYGDIDSVWKIQYRISDIFRFMQPNLEKDMDPKDVEYAAINGMLNTLDPHSVHISPKMYRELKLSTRGKFGGLGIQIGIRDGKLTIISPIPGTPAWRAGIKAKDTIIKIDGQSTVNMSLDQAVSLMRGDPGTPCKLSVMRKGFTNPKDFDLIRDIIKIQSVKNKLLANHIGYLQILNFHETTDKEVRSALEEMSKQGKLKGLILDLRGNPGGLLDAAVKVADLFLDSGVIVTTVGAGNEALEVEKASFLGTEHKYPIIVQVGSSSASASEIVAGALKNNNRAVVLGDRTFGKGSVQVIYQMDDGSALKLTVAQYLTPGDISIQSVGVVPDIELLPVFIEKDNIDFYTSEKMRREFDLDKHLEHASTMHDKPFESLQYLYDEKRDEYDIDAPADYVHVKDFTTQLAHTILKTVGAISRREILLQRSIDVLAKTASDQEAHMVAAFKKFHINWSTKEEKSETPQTAATISVKPQKILKAGDEANISLKVTNNGNFPLYRLRAITDSDNLLYDGLEFFLGKVAPGKSKTYTAKLPIPKDSPDSADDVVFRFYEANNNIPAPLTQRFDIRSQVHPSFSYTYQLVDDKGNKDNLIQVGETLDLVVTIFNNGPGDMAEGLATLRNSDNLKAIFINTGRVKFDPLKVNQSTEVTFTFRVDPGLEESSFPMDITIWDPTLRDFLSQEITFKIKPPMAFTPQKGKLVRVAAGTPVYASPDEESPVLARAEKESLLKVKTIGNEWLGIALKEVRRGYIRAGNEVSKSMGQKATRLKALPGIRPPVITLAESSKVLYTDVDHLLIEGQVQDDNHIQDLYILTNGDKAYFKSNKRGTNPLQMPFSALIELKEGSNRINIVARENDEFVGQKTLLIYRQKSDPAATAQAK